MRIFENLPTAERVEAAKEKTRRIVDHLLYLLALHENNAIVLYSPTVSAQIPTSFAANAFNTFQRGLHLFEIVRLCALWDSARPDRESIPTVIQLIDDSDVIETLVQETAAQWQKREPQLPLDDIDPELHNEVIQQLRLNQEGFAQQEAQKAREGLRKAIHDSRLITSSQKLQSILNLRHKSLAHSLSVTDLERKLGEVEPMKYGYERDVLNSTLPIVEALYCWVNGCSFLFENSQKIARKNAEALWTACTFNIRR